MAITFRMIITIQLLCTVYIQRQICPICMCVCERESESEYSHVLLQCFLVRTPALFAICECIFPHFRQTIDRVSTTLCTIWMNICVVVSMWTSLTFSFCSILCFYFYCYRVVCVRWFSAFAQMACCTLELKYWEITTSSIWVCSGWKPHQLWLMFELYLF